MAAYVYFDHTGQIQSIVTVEAPAGYGAFLAPRAGQFVAEIELPEPFREDPHAEVRALAESYVVDAPKASLRKRQ